jgi:hypothetical protein
MFTVNPVAETELTEVSSNVPGAPEFPVTITAGAAEKLPAGNVTPAVPRK